MRNDKLRNRPVLDVLDFEFCLRSPWQGQTRGFYGLYVARGLDALGPSNGKKLFYNSGAWVGGGKRWPKILVDYHLLHSMSELDE